MSELINAVKAGKPVAELISTAKNIDITEIKIALMLAIIRSNSKEDPSSQNIQNINTLLKKLMKLASGTAVAAEAPADSGEYKETKHKMESQDGSKCNEAILALAEIELLLCQKDTPEFDGIDGKNKRQKAILTHLQTLYLDKKNLVAKTTLWLLFSEGDKIAETTLRESLKILDKFPETKPKKYPEFVRAKADLEELCNADTTYLGWDTCLKKVRVDDSKQKQETKNTINFYVALKTYKNVMRFHKLNGPEEEHAKALSEYIRQLTNQLLTDKPPQLADILFDWLFNSIANTKQLSKHELPALRMPSHLQVIVDIFPLPMLVDCMVRVVHQDKKRMQNRLEVVLLQLAKIEWDSFVSKLFGLAEEKGGAAKKSPEMIIRLEDILRLYEDALKYLKSEAIIHSIAVGLDKCCKAIKALQVEKTLQEKLSLLKIEADLRCAEKISNINERLQALLAILRAEYPRTQAIKQLLGKVVEIYGGLQEEQATNLEKIEQAINDLQTIQKVHEKNVDFAIYSLREKQCGLILKITDEKEKRNQLKALFSSQRYSIDDPLSSYLNGGAAQNYVEVYLLALKEKITIQQCEAGLKDLSAYEDYPTIANAFEKLSKKYQDIILETPDPIHKKVILLSAITGRNGFHLSSEHIRVIIREYVYLIQQDTATSLQDIENGLIELLKLKKSIHFDKKEIGEVKENRQEKQAAEDSSAIDEGFKALADIYMQLIFALDDLKHKQQRLMFLLNGQDQYIKDRSPEFVERIAKEYIATLIKLGEFTVPIKQLPELKNKFSAVDIGSFLLKEAALLYDLEKQKTVLLEIIGAHDCRRSPADPYTPVAVKAAEEYVALIVKNVLPEHTNTAITVFKVLFSRGYLVAQKGIIQLRQIQPVIDCCEALNAALQSIPVPEELAIASLQNLVDLSIQINVSTSFFFADSIEATFSNDAILAAVKEQKLNPAKILTKLKEIAIQQFRQSNYSSAVKLFGALFNVANRFDLIDTANFCIKNLNLIHPRLYKLVPKDKDYDKKHPLVAAQAAAGEIRMYAHGLIEDDENKNAKKLVAGDEKEGGQQTLLSKMHSDLFNGAEGARYLAIATLKRWFLFARDKNRRIESAKLIIGYYWQINKSQADKFPEMLTWLLLLIDNYHEDPHSCLITQYDAKGKSNTQKTFLIKNILDEIYDLSPMDSPNKPFINFIEYFLQQRANKYQKEIKPNGPDIEQELQPNLYLLQVFGEWSSQHASSAENVKGMLYTGLKNESLYPDLRAQLLPSSVSRRAESFEGKQGEQKYASGIIRDHQRAQSVVTLLPRFLVSPQRTQSQAVSGAGSPAKGKPVEPIHARPSSKSVAQGAAVNKSGSDIVPRLV